ncbi:MAG: hypothetical protein P4L27_08065 [Ignavibacteriaceae bacterium]|nr:hypothetical protein [Ignavibacteriaceae bacterium]
MKVIVLSPKMTPIESFSERLFFLSEPKLGSIVIKAILEESHIFFQTP